MFLFWEGLVVTPRRVLWDLLGCRKYCLRLSAGFSECIELLHIYDLCLDMYVYLNSKQEEGDDWALSMGSAPVRLCHLVLTPMGSQEVFISLPAEAVKILRDDTVG